MSDIQTSEEEELAEYRRIKAAYLVELSARNNRMHPNQFHGHSHSIDGIWDGDNGPLAGKECVVCMLHRAATEPKP